MTLSLGDWLSEVANWVFLAIAVPTLFAAAMVVTTTNIVRAVLYLVVTLAGTAALFLMLGAEFVAWTVVLVYIGAVVILFLIGIMITRAPLGAEATLSHPASVRIPAALLSLVIFAVTTWAFADAFRNEMIPVPEAGTSTGDLAEVLFDRFVIPFEVVSFVLLAALIGGIAIARRDPEEAPR
jgi:NADH-quinone oxidoreductase subunit J